MAARADILEKVKKSRQEAERRIQESNKKDEQARQASQREYEQNTSSEIKQAASYMKKYSTPERAGNTVSDYAQKRKQLTSWYKGDKPTEIETLAKIVKETERDRAFGEKLYGYYEQAKQEGEWAETYDKATSRYAAALGLPEGTAINDEFFEQMKPYFAAGVTTDAGNLSTAKKNGADALFAANLAGLYDDYQKTKVLQVEEAAAMKEAQYWIAKGLTDEEIIQKLNIGGENSKYKQLTAAMNKTKTGEYEPTTAPIQLLTSYGVQGMLYGLRNPNDASGDYKMDAVKAAMGRGVQVSATSDEIARRTPGSGSWAPYSNGTTMDDEAITLGTGPNVSPDWFDQNRNRIFATGTDDEKKAFASMWAAEETQKRVDAEYAALLDEASRFLADVSLYENAEDLIKQLFYDADGNVKYKELAKLDESLLSGQIVALTRGTDYDYKSFTQEITRQFNIKKANEDAAKNPEALATAVENEKEALIRKNGTVYDKSTLPKSQTNEVVSVFDEPSADILTEGLMWASTTVPSSRPKNDTRFEDTRPIYERMAGQYAGWSDEQKEAADDYIYSTENGYDLSESIEAMRSTGLSDEEINSFRSQVSEAISTQGYKSEYAFDWFEPAAVTNTGVDNQQAIWAAIGDGDYLTAAELQYQNIAGLMENSDDPAISEIVHSAGSQKAAATLMTMVVEGRLPEQIEDPKVKAELQTFEKYALKALGVEKGVLDQMVYGLDRLLNMNGKLIDAQENEGLGLSMTLQLAWEGAMSKGSGLVDDLIGEALVIAGSAFKSDALVEQGKKIAATEDSRQAHYNQLLADKGTPLEILAGQYGGEAIHMSQMSKIAGALMGFGAAKLGSTYKFLTRMIGSLPFAAEAGASNFHETYAETDNVLISSATSLATTAVTALMSQFDGVLKNIEASGMPYIPEVVEKLSASPGSGALAGVGRWGKGFALWLGNLGKTAVNEALQEPAENVATTFVTDLIKGQNPFDRDWKEYGKELRAEGAGAALISLGSSASTLSSYARTVKVVESQMGKSELTPADIETFVHALQEDMADPQIVSEMQERAEAIVVEARTGELVSEGALPEVDNSAVVAAEKSVQEKTETAAQATAEKDAAYAQFRENPADDAATSRLSAAVKQEQKAVMDAQDAQAELAEAQASVQAQSEAAMEAVRTQARAEVEQARTEAAAVKEQAELESLPYVERFSREFDKWDKKQIGKEFVVGHTSDTLLSLGVPDADINLLSDKLIKIQKNHPAMTDEVIKQIPNIIENPVVVMKSRTVPDRLTMFGEVIDANGNPVLAIIDTSMKANTKTGRIDVDVIRLNSAYGKDTDAQGFIDRSEVVYVDKNRADNWSRSTRLYLPIGEDANGSDNSIAQNADAVNTSVSDGDAENAELGVSQFAGQTGQKERQFVKQTMYNAEIIPDYVREALRANAKTHFYDVDTNDDQVARGYQRVLENGYEQERDRLLDLDRYAADDAAEAAVLMAMAQHEGDAETLLSLAAKDAQERTQAGKELQSFKILGKMTPTGARAFVAGHTENKLMADLKSRPALKEEADSNAKQIAEKLKNAPVQADGEASADNKWSVPLTAKQAALIEEYGLSKVERPGIHYNRATMKQRMLEAILATPDPTRPTGGGLSLIQRLEYMQKGLPVVTQADLDYIGTQMEQFVVLGQEEGGRDADLAIARAYEAFGNITPATRLEKFRTQRYVNMLTSVPSFLRNIIGNAGQGVVNATAHGIAVEIDRLASIGSGRRTMEHLSFQERVDGWKTFAEETKNTFLDYFVDKVNTAPNREKYSTNQKGRTFQNNVQETVKDVESFMMSVGDRNVWKKAYVNSMAEQQKLAERGLLRNDDGTEVTMEQMVERAEADANYQTYTEDNLVQDVLGYVKSKSPVAADVLSLYAPFTGVTTNIMKRSIQYSPAGLITMAGRMAVNKAKGKKFDQRAFVNDLSRALTGTGGILMGMLLGAGGVIRMGTEDEEGNKAYDVATAKGEQYTPYVYDPITDTYVSMSTFAPFASPLVWGAAIGEALKGDADQFDVLLSAITNSTDSILDASYLSGISDLFGGYGSFTENLAQVTATNLVSQLTPAFLTQIANACDPYVRDTKDKSFITELLKTTASRIPFLRNTVLPKKLDVAGQPTETKGWWSLLDPFSRTKPSDLEALNEVDRLYDLLGDSSVLPSDAARGRTNVLKVNGKRVTLTDEGKEWYKQHYGDLWIEAVNELMSRADYQLSMTDEERAKWISKVLSKAYNTAKEDALEKYGADPEEE